MDTQIWYAIFSTIVGGILGAFSHLGEVCAFLVRLVILQIIDALFILYFIGVFHAISYEGDKWK